MYTFFLLTLAIGQPQPEKELVSPAQIIGLVVNDLATKVKPEDAPFQRYFSMHCIPEEDRPAFRRVFRFWINHLSTAKSILPEVEVAGGLIVRYDIRRAPNWTRKAWEVVGNRDYLFREPLIPTQQAEFIRRACGVKQDPKTLASVIVMNAWQLFRDSIESNKANTYYDLLYAAERFPDGDIVIPIDRPTAKPQTEWKTVVTEWEGGVWPADGKTYPKGSFTYNKWVEVPVKGIDNPFPVVAESKKKGIANFPETGADFEKKWGGNNFAEAIKNTGVDPRVGGIGLGKLDGDGAGSFVALRTRAVRVTPSDFGVVTRTFDVFKVQGDKDHMERFGQIAKGDIKADGSEILATLPNGSQAGLLVGGDDKRVEIAPSNLAQVDSKIDKYLDVRTHMSCVVCHLPSGGFITFEEQVTAAKKYGLELASDDPIKQQQIEDFYTSWTRKIKGWQDPYLYFVEQTTYDARTKKSWTPVETVKQFQRFRDLYDGNVNLAIASRELGVSEDRLKLIVLQYRPVKTRPNQLALGKSVPREAWEDPIDGVAREMFLILDADKGQEERIKLMLKDLLIQKAIEEFELKLQERK